MGNGEDSGTWGTITNTNWNLIEQSVAGVQTITMANANYTLSNLNGVSDEARNMVLNIVGTNSGIYQVVAPLVSKFYIISNNTAGGYAITIGASTGSIITVPNGVTVQVYCDGSTGFFSAQTGSAGNFLVNGNFSCTGNEVDVGNMTVGGTLSTSGKILTTSGNSGPTVPANFSIQSSGAYGGGLAFIDGVYGIGLYSVNGTLNFSSGSNTSIAPKATLDVSGSFTAASFNGSGAGLTGTAASLSIGGNAATATNATNSTNATYGRYVYNNGAVGGTIGYEEASSLYVAYAASAGNSNTVNYPFPSGTRMVFAQASAPTGWTQDTSDTANNRMMRVVNSAGNGVGGSYDPTVMNVVPYHTHGFTSGTESVGHSHYMDFFSQGQNADHYHNVNGGTGGMSANNPHSHSISDPGHTHVISPAYFGVSYPNGLSGSGGAGQSYGATQSATTGIGVNSSDINHSHSFNVNSGYTSNGHAHEVAGQSQGESNTHTHSGSTDGGSSQTNWTPRYVNLIICQKN